MPELSGRYALDRAIARAACRAAALSLWRGLLRPSRSLVRAQAGAILAHLPVALYGPWWRLVAATFSLWDRQEGVAAFLEKRKAAFKGR